MAMGKRKPRQESLLISTDRLTPSSGHPFYEKHNAILAEAGFDRWVESRCVEYYATEETRGQPPRYSSQRMTDEISGLATIAHHDR